MLSLLPSKASVHIASSLAKKVKEKEMKSAAVFNGLDLQVMSMASTYISPGCETKGAVKCNARVLVLNNCANPGTI